MADLRQKRVVLGVTGGIAAYKAAELVRLLVKDGVEVQVVMTQVIGGLDESMAPSDRAARMQLFVEFLKEIDLARPGASDQVSEVDLSDAQDVRANIAGLPGLEQQQPVAVHFGDADFVNKYRLLVENIGPWRASAGRVESVDLRFSRQVVVNPESDAVARATPSAVAQAGKR